MVDLEIGVLQKNVPTDLVIEKLKYTSYNYNYFSQNIEPGQTHIETFNLTPPYSGRSTIVAKFSSKELDDVDGFLAYVVAQNDGGGATGAVASNEVVEENMENGGTSAVNGSYVNGET